MRSLWAHAQALVPCWLSGRTPHWSEFRATRTSLGVKDFALVGILSQQTAAGSGKAAGRCFLFGDSPESQNQGLDQNRA